MADARIFDLSYGHLGQAIYDRESKCWRFSREPGRHHVLQPLGPYETAISPPPMDGEPSQDLEHSIQRIARNHPEVVPGLSLLPSLAQLSQAVTATARTHDPTVSRCFAIGEARDLDNQRSGLRTVPILATVGGAAGESVRLLRIQAQKLGWKGSERESTVQLRAHGFRDGEEGWWSGSCGPVKQVCFAQDQGRGGSWLAVRQIDSTAILRPLYHRIPVAPSRAVHHGTRYASSRVDPNLILTLSIHQTGGSPHADVTFNPWYHRQIAISDQEGCWSIWDVEGKRSRRSTYKAKMYRSGSISHGLKAGQAGLTHQDGWGAVCWVGNASTLVVCNRRHFVILDLRHDPALHLETPDLGICETSRWILDVKRSPINANHLFVVTTSRIFWLQVTTGIESTEAKNRPPKCAVLLSWTHSRHEEDISLQAEIMGFDQHALLLLYSRLTSLVTTFQFAMSLQQHPSLPLSVSDPYKVDPFPEVGRHAGLGKDDDVHMDVTACEKKGISDLLLLPLHYSLQANLEPKGPGHMYRDHDVRFYTLLVLGNDLGLRSRLYTSGVPMGGWRSQARRPREPVKLPRNNSRRTSKAKSTTWVLDDRFVVDDAEVTDSSSDDHAPPQRASPGKSNHNASSSHRQNRTAQETDEDPWTLDWEWLYKLAFPEAHFEDPISSTLDARNSPPTAHATEQRDPEPLTSSASAVPPTEDLSSARLRAYAPVNPQPALPAQLENILAHWTLDQDPAHYSWEETTSSSQQHTLHPISIGDDDDDDQHFSGHHRRRRDHHGNRAKRHRHAKSSSSSQHVVPPTSQDDHPASSSTTNQGLSAVAAAGAVPSDAATRAPRDIDQRHDGSGGNTQSSGFVTREKKKKKRAAGF